MCMIIVGKVAGHNEDKVIVDIDGKKREVDAGVPVRIGDMVLLSGDRLVKKLEVVR